ncbi:MAG: hypothetical protein H6739_05620 [Alphaproteobacteria bacterium]|nr:hypothetical protein [Alphaproteobacteria bacterium]
MSDHGHNDMENAAPLTDALTVLVPVIGVMFAFGFTVYLIVSSSIH